MVLLCADGGGITRNRTLPSVLTTGQVLSFLSGSSLLFSPLPRCYFLLISPPPCAFSGGLVAVLGMIGGAVQQG